MTMLAEMTEKIVAAFLVKFFSTNTAGIPSIPYLNAGYYFFEILRQRQINRKAPTFIIDSVVSTRKVYFKKRLTVFWLDIVSVLLISVDTRDAMSRRIAPPTMVLSVQNKQFIAKTMKSIPSETKNLVIGNRFLYF